MSPLVEVAPPPSPCGIVGSRKFRNLAAVDAFVDALPSDAVVVSGGAPGVDQRAERRARQRGLGLISYRPEKDGKEYRIRLYEWNARGDSSEATVGFAKTFPQAAHMRNSMVVERLVQEAGCLSAFHDGTSHGTASTIGKAKAAGILYAVFEDGPQE